MQVLVIDDHAIFRDGLVALLARESPGIEVREAGSLAEARGIVQHSERPFALVLLDLNLGDAKVDSVARETVAMFRGIPVVVLSGLTDPRLVRSAIEAGAMGFIPKTLSFSEFSRALARALSGEVYVPRMAWNEGLRCKKSVGADGVADAVKRLPPRQLEILRLLVYGLSNREIARHLDISEGTVKTHMGRILPALGVHTRAEAVYLLAQVEQSIGRHGAESA